VIRALPIALLISGTLAVAGCGGSSSSSGEGGVYGSSEEGTTATQASKEESTGGSYGGETGGRYGEGASTSPSGGGAASVSTGSASGVGTVLVDSNGMTLYYFEKDKKGTKTSACNGACASAWPPLTTSGAAKAMSRAKSSQMGTIERSDGTTQVTYAGWPLYAYTADTAPGEANGTDVKAFGGSWYPLHPNGEKAGD
jgi:predicted lipoprotein with Yx(FWY)xxD motif